jgi:ribonuclease BN (tRNA processing enzyme)
MAVGSRSTTRSEVAVSVALLGTKGGPAIRPGSTMPTSSLLRMGGREIVVDCGLGVTRALCDQGMQLRDLSAVFVTHLHSDHYLELGPLIHTAWTAGLSTPVTVWGPEGLARYWEAFVVSMAADIDLRIADEGRPNLRGLVSVRVLEEGPVAGLDGIEVRAMRVLHPPLVDCFALSFAGEGKRVVFSGDTAYLPALADLARGADLLVHEAMLEAALPALVARVGNADGRLMAHLVRSHTSAADAARIAAAAGVGALALHHLIPSDDPAWTEAHWRAAVGPHWSGPLHVGRDGMVIVL